MTDPIVSKAEFARLTGKTRSLVSKWIARGLIDGEALVGPAGPKQQIRPDLAQKQLQSRRDPAKVLGAKVRQNGEVPSRTSSRTQAAADPFASVGLAVDEFAAGATMMGMVLAYDIGAAAAGLAVGAGASMRVAYVMKSVVTIALIEKLEAFLSDAGLAPEEAEIGFELAAFADLDWPALAAAAGEPVDLAAWQAWQQERFGQAAADEG